MGWMGAVGKRIAREHGYIAGYGWVVAGARITAQQWTRLRRPLCPKCGEGYLFPAQVEADRGGPDLSGYVGCSRCDHYEAAGRNKDAETIARLHALAEQRFADPVEREAKVRQYRAQSRCMYGLALVCLGIALWMMASNPVHTVYINVAMIGLFVMAKGMRASYRGWQVQHSRFFEPGLFRIWFSSGKWFL
ncbi:hypothetical protein FAZ69_08415 [Trinickia terrae]|uniref:Uncharacterized protein n=1 Tax=Trinickia terrae TaxID=2571161 RepID=A0A4U1I9K4_9BURK|nr:hypothetical protein [Trinickia terrae]TKC90162.1 hypothetical protein FAZ69_08415 [Trinickia terrae]